MSAGFWMLLDEHWQYFMRDLNTHIDELADAAHEELEDMCWPKTVPPPEPTIDIEHCFDTMRRYPLRFGDPSGQRQWTALEQPSCSCSHGVLSNLFGGLF